MKKRNINFKNSEEEFKLHIGVIVIIFLLIAYFISLGKLNFLQEKEQKSKRLQWIEEQLELLEIKSKNKIEIKKQLDERVKKWFLYTRGVLGVIYLSINCIGFHFISNGNFNEKISIILNYNQVVFFISLTVLFVRYEAPSDFKDFFRLIHLQIKKMVYKSHKELVNEIELLSIEINKLSDEKKYIQKESNEINSNENLT